MAPTFLIVGATGNTGRAVVRTLAERIGGSPFSNYRILAQTRSANSTTAQEFAKLPNVEVVEQNWTDITPQWLREQGVERAFIASHNNPNQFAEEGTFLVAALNAGIKYVVRISTTAANVRPDNAAYYPRTHWAIEAMLSSPEFEKLQWSSLQPNIFMQYCLRDAVEIIKAARSGGDQPPFRTLLNEDAPTGIIDPDEVGLFAAIILLHDDISVHNRRRYVLNGPEDHTGRSLLALVEERIGTKVKDVRFNNMELLDSLVAAQPNESENVIRSIKYAGDAVWAGLASASTTSKEVLELAPPKMTAAKMLDMMLEE